MILVYCDHITERHRFIFDFIFRDILDSDCQLTTDKREFSDFQGPKFSYTSGESPGDLHFTAHPFIFEKWIFEQHIDMTEWSGMPVFFQVKGSAWPFDPFSMSFYLVSRYEEYLPFTPDQHGRFTPEQSLAFKEGFLRLPLVDAIVQELKKFLESRFPGIKLPGRPFRFIPSFDIDIAYAHLGKGWKRSLAGWIKLGLKLDFGEIKARISTLKGKISDPYDNFQLHLDLAEKYGHRLLYFVLLGNFGRYDRNTNHLNNRFRQLLSSLNLSAGIGLHPSYRSYLHPGILNKEKKRLEEIIRRPVVKSRFHFLRLNFPQSFRDLIQEGILEDYSLGYSSMNGFRASTCTPFYFYDLEKEERTDLRLHPFIFMDSAMTDHLKISPEEAVLEIIKLTMQVKTFGGEAIGIWHNYALNETGEYVGWRKVLVSILEHFKNISA